MTERNSFSPPPAFHRAVIQLRCEKCGRETAAACDCSVPYRPVQARVAEYDQANPGKSERTAAADLGVSKTAVHEARESGGHRSDHLKVTGRDGKAYPARREPAEPDPPAPIPGKKNEGVLQSFDTPVTRDHEADRKLAHELIDIGYRALAAKLQADKAGMARLKHIVETMREAWTVNWF
jgi:hypothetical protein